MNCPLFFGTIVLASMPGIGLAPAQTSVPEAGGDLGSATGTTSQASPLKLSPAQRVAILNAVLRNSAKIAVPSNFQASLGNPVPPSVELYALPSDTQSLQARGL